jgi:hypothetical protein
MHTFADWLTDEQAIPKFFRQQSDAQQIMDVLSDISTHHEQLTYLKTLFPAESDNDLRLITRVIFDYKKFKDRFDEFPLTSMRALVGALNRDIIDANYVKLMTPTERLKYQILLHIPRSVGIALTEYNLREFKELYGNKVFDMNFEFTPEEMLALRWIDHSPNSIRKAHIMYAYLALLFCAVLVIILVAVIPHPK